ncbi:RWD domain containing 1 [Strigomonas culicis]|uniref:RWD domain containing 1 n=1 Tax=Strigomonas culicis TaxID=28005 RepID=S9VXX0_9TRYP|nr:RWD domain containing 1 [Strigomonas culicis]EPY34698.1 RWD domain containing 1 [Strigomonas culicis]|eukprot:EPY28490.1 RWD domain containing 1 [Strigomonas culicis]
MPAATDMQQMEIDMVEGMYDTFELLSEDPPTYTVLMAASADDPVELRVTITYPTEDYPETAPCDVQVENISKHRRIQTAEISKSVAALCEDNLGMHVAILVLQHAQEFLCHSAEQEEKAELARRGEAMEAAAGGGKAAPDPTIRLGTAVTRELFHEWSRKHHAEKEKRRAEAEAKRSQKVSASTLSGRQLWDNTLRAADWDLFGAADVAADEGADVDVDYDLRNDELNEEDFDFGDE